MRRAFNDTAIITDDNEKIMGVNLGFDFCAEHEFGIKRLYQDFGMKREEELGYESVRNTIAPKGLFFQLKKSSAALIYQRFANSPKDLEDVLRYTLYLPSGDETGIACAWSGESFGLNVPNIYKNVPKMLYEAFLEKNGIIILGGNKNPFARGGLMLLDYALISEKWKEEARKSDSEYREEQRKFRQIENESGIFELMKKSGKEFYYLSIGRLDEKGQPLWWLNPSEQQKYESGWYHTEELKQWAEDKGPVVERRKNR